MNVIIIIESPTDMFIQHTIYCEWAPTYSHYLLIATWSPAMIHCFERTQYMNRGWLIAGFISMIILYDLIFTFIIRIVLGDFTNYWSHLLISYNDILFLHFNKLYYLNIYYKSCSLVSAQSNVSWQGSKSLLVDSGCR